MPNFKITHPQTGKTISIVGDVAPSEQEIDEIFAKTANTPAQQPAGLPNIGDSVKGVGDFLMGNSMRVAQDVGTGLRNITSSGTINKLDQMASDLERKATLSTNPEEKKQLLKQATDIRMTQSSESGDIGKSFSRDVNQNPLWRGLKGGVEIAGTAELPAAITSAVKTLPKIVSGTTNLVKGGLQTAGEVANTAKNVLKSPSYKKTAEWASKVAEEGAKAGKSIDSDTLLNNISKRLFGDPELGIKGEVLPTRELRKAFEKFKAMETPSLRISHTDPLPMGPTSSNVPLDPEDLLKLRRQIVETYGDKGLFKNILQSLSGKPKSPAEQLVAKHARNVVTEELKALVPDINNPDKLYSFYKKMGGDLPTWTKRIIGGIIADKVLENTVLRRSGTQVVKSVSGL